MRKRIFALISAFIISINCMCFMSLNVYASDDLSGFDSWSLTEKMNYWGYNALQIYYGACGIVHGNPTTLNLFLESEYDKLLLEDSTYEEWICARMGVQQNTTTGEYELVLDDELVDLMKQACDKYIEEETGFFLGRTFQIADTYSIFHTKSQYSAVSNIIKNLDADQFGVLSVFTSGNGLYLSDSEGVATFHRCLAVLTVIQSDGFVKNPSYSGAVNMYYNWTDASFATDNYKQIYIFDYDGNELSDVYGNDDSYSAFNSSAKLFHTATMANANSVCQCSSITPNTSFIVASDKREVRIYNNYEEYKAYTVGQRTYYATSDFYNYDSSQDNSVTLTDSDLSNGSVYGDVYNYIINNYDNPDGLTEDELRDILDDYFDNSGGGSSSSGDDSDSGSSGNGLLDFLGGLGSIGDAILSILGKLMEYIGKALDLIGGTVTKVIDIIPKNITALLGALFPFFPEEWLTAIELGLVLAVIVGIVGLFKK